MSDRLEELEKTVADIARAASTGGASFGKENKHHYLKEITNLCKIAGYDVIGMKIKKENNVK